MTIRIYYAKNQEFISTKRDKMGVTSFKYFLVSHLTQHKKITGQTEFPRKAIVYNY